DDEATVPRNLHDRLGRSELVDSRAHDTFGASDRVGSIGYHAPRRIDLEREMHATSEIESELDGHSTNRAVAHLPGLRVVQSLFDGTRHEREHASGHEGEDEDHSPLDGFHVDGSPALESTRRSGRVAGCERLSD